MPDRLATPDTLQELSLRDLLSLIPERRWPSHPNSRIEIIAGCMFSGKTSELFDRIRRARIAKHPAQIFKPVIDDRYGGINKANSHNGDEDNAIPVKNSTEILLNIITSDSLKNLLVVGIEEVQFLDDEILDVMLGLRAKGFRVIAAGLNTDFRGEPFGPMPKILSNAEDITKTHAICVVCGEQADYTHRIVNGNPARDDDPIIMIGAKESYEAVCYEHHTVIGKQRLVPKQGE